MMKLFVNYIKFLTNPLLRDSRDDFYYFCLRFGSNNKYYDVYIRWDEKGKEYLEVKLPIKYTGPHDPTLLAHKWHPEDFYEYVSPLSRKFDIPFVISQLREKVLLRGALHLKAVRAFESFFPNEDLEKALKDVNEFAEQLTQAVKEMVKEKQKKSMKLIDGKEEEEEPVIRLDD